MSDGGGRQLNDQRRDMWVRQWLYVRQRLCRVRQAAVCVRQWSCMGQAVVVRHGVRRGSGRAGYREASRVRQAVADRHAPRIDAEAVSALAALLSN